MARLGRYGNAVGRTLYKRRPAPRAAAQVEYHKQPIYPIPTQPPYPSSPR